MCAPIRGLTGPPPPAHQIKADVLAMVKQSTDAYKKIKSYSAEVSLKTEISRDSGSETTVGHFVLALDRANRFCYRDMTEQTGTAAVCDGKKLINYKSDRNQFTEGPAPTDYRGINIVDDVQFEPLATYLIALMLQGDALADKDIRESLEKANVGTPVVENGKKWQILHLLFGPLEESCDIFIGEDHLIAKSTTKLQSNNRTFLQTEQLTNIKVNKPVDPAVFIYSPPANAQKVDRFLPPQRPGDALVRPLKSPGARLAAFSGPQIKGLNKDVAALIDQSSEAYGKLKSYRHVAVFRAAGTKDGKKVDQSAKFSLAMVRPNKLAFKMVSKPNVAAVCDGITFTDFRSGEYVRLTAPPTIKDLHLEQDDFDPVAGSYLIALLLQNKAYGDPKLLGILLKASVHKGIVADSKTWDALDFPMPDGLSFVLYFDPSTHYLSWAAAKVPDQDLILTETFQDVELNKDIAAAEFTFALPATAKRVHKL
jgi:outer membrane lipoprotein-sorting protein